MPVDEDRVLRHRVDVTAPVRGIVTLGVMTTRFTIPTYHFSIVVTPRYRCSNFLDQQES
jgi:hypothetical protein